MSTTGTLAVGDYDLSGTDRDTDGDLGTWSYTLDVTAGTLGQVAPTTGAVTPGMSAGFGDQLAVSGAFGTVAYSPATSTPTGVLVSSSGAVSTTGTLAVGDYDLSGTDRDTLGDIGSWSYTLDVTAGTLAQAAPAARATVPAGSSTFTAELAVAGANGTVAWNPATSTPAGVLVSSSGRSAPRATWRSAATPSRAPTTTPTATRAPGTTPST